MDQAFSPAKAIWENRQLLTEWMPEIRGVRSVLQEAMGGPRDFVRQQWLQIASLVYDFKPDLIIELGRGYGNSTCAMSVAAKMLRPALCRIVSCCLANEFNRISRPYLEQHLSDPGILAPLEAIETDILTFDFNPFIKDAKRVFVFWDAHGFDVARTILTNLLQKLKDCPHVAVIHDMADLAYMPADLRAFDSYPKWMRYGTADPKYVLGNVGGQYEEVIALVDFVSRNKMEIRSAESSYFPGLSLDQVRELETLFGDDFSQFGFWYYFSLNWAEGRDLSFPELYPPAQPTVVAETPPDLEPGPPAQPEVPSAKPVGEEPPPHGNKPKPATASHDFLKRAKSMLRYAFR